MTSISQQIERLLTQKAAIDRDAKSAVSNGALYSLWLIDAVELLLYIEQERHNAEASK